LSHDDLGNISKKFVTHRIIQNRPEGFGESSKFCKSNLRDVVLFTFHQFPKFPNFIHHHTLQPRQTFQRHRRLFVIRRVRFHLAVTAGREVVLVRPHLLLGHPELAGQAVELRLWIGDLRFELR
jgi:hypothetical protein